MLTQLIITSAAVALMTTPLLAIAATSTDPISQFGILGAYNNFTLSGAGQSVDGSLPEAGLFYNFGNKMTAEAGFIYQAGLDLKSGKDSGDKLRDLQGDLDLGWRMALGERDSLDVIGGGGYARSRYTTQIDRYDIGLGGSSPFFKAAMGYTHRFDAATLRLEAGVRRTTEGDFKLKVNGVDVVTVDLKNRTNPYAEANVLFNTQGSLPIITGVYYSQTGYQLNINNSLVRRFELQRDEFGAKVGIVF